MNKPAVLRPGPALAYPRLPGGSRLSGRPGGDRVPCRPCSELHRWIFRCSLSCFFSSFTSAFRCFFSARSLCFSAFRRFLSTCFWSLCSEGGVTEDRVRLDTPQAPNCLGFS